MRIIVMAENPGFEAPALTARRQVWTVFLDIEGTDPSIEVFAAPEAAHARAARLAGMPFGQPQADGSSCYQDGAGSFYTVRPLPVQG
jgi:hypothetical protein